MTRAPADESSVVEKQQQLFNLTDLCEKVLSIPRDPLLCPPPILEVNFHILEVNFRHDN